MRATHYLAAALSLASLAGLAQTAQPKPELLLYHPSGPPLAYEVATIKPIDPDAANQMVRLPPGGSARSTALSPLTIRRYIMNAYGAAYEAEVAGGPDWLNKDAYQITGKPSEDLLAAQQTMKREDQINQNRVMQQSLLADRFHLKAHFETRVLPVYELVPAKGGLKITEAPAPLEHKPGDPPQTYHSGDPLPPGSMKTMFNNSGLRVFDARAIKMENLARTISFAAAAEVEDRPVVDHTGFTGYFDITGLTWAPLGDASAASTPEAPSLSVAIQEKLGLKLVPARDPIEVLVIDSIDRPSPN
jgi:bla regulator protein blaR1